MSLAQEQRGSGRARSTLPAVQKKRKGCDSNRVVTRLPSVYRLFYSRRLDYAFLHWRVPLAVAFRIWTALASHAQVAQYQSQKVHGNALISSIRAVHSVPLCKARWESFPFLFFFFRFLLVYACFDSIEHWSFSLFFFPPLSTTSPKCNLSVLPPAL